MNLLKNYALPTPLQQLLLNACLLEGDIAITSWQKWRSQVDFDEYLDLGSFRLLPLLYKNLVKHNVNDELLAKFKGIYRQTWYKNNLLLAKTTTVLQEISNLGIPLMLLKGLPIALLDYHDLGLRPMDDIDILVPISSAIAVVNLLTELGFNYDEFAKHSLQDYIEHYHSLNCTHPQMQIDVHWWIAKNIKSPNTNAQWLNRSITCSWADQDLRCPSSSDRLLHTCIHGMEYNVVPPIRWIADAVIIIRANPYLDWQNTLLDAEENHLATPFLIALSYLDKNCYAPIPDAVITQLTSMVATSNTQITHTIAVNKYLHLLNQKVDAISAHYRRYQSVNSQPNVWGFMRYLQGVWGINNWQDFLPAFRQKLLKIFQQLKSL